MNVARPLVQSGLLGEAIDHAPLLVLVADEDMHYVAVNAHACEVLGYDREELLQLRVTDVARYPEAAVEYAEMMAERGGAGTAEVTRKDGSRLSIEWRTCETTVAGMPLYACVAWPL